MSHSQLVALVIVLGVILAIALFLVGLYLRRAAQARAEVLRTQEARDDYRSLLAQTREEKGAIRAELAATATALHDAGLTILAKDAELAVAGRVFDQVEEMVEGANQKIIGWDADHTEREVALVGLQRDLDQALSDLHGLAGVHAELGRQYEERTQERDAFAARCVELREIVETQRAVAVTLVEAGDALATKVVPQAHAKLKAWFEIADQHRPAAEVLVPDAVIPPAG